MPSQVAATPIRQATAAAQPTRLVRRSAVAAGPFAFATNYATPVAVVPQGGTLTFGSADIAPHDVVEVVGAGQTPRFSSPRIGLGQTADVSGVSALAPGQYSFHCTLHANMTGTLIVR